MFYRREHEGEKRLRFSDSAKEKDHNDHKKNKKSSKKEKKDNGSNDQNKRRVLMGSIKKPEELFLNLDARLQESAGKTPHAMLEDLGKEVFFCNF